MSAFDQAFIAIHKMRDERDELVATLRQCEHVFALEGTPSYMLDLTRAALAKIVK